MTYRRLGRTDVEVSAVGLGCWQFAGGSMWGEQEDRDSVRAVHASLDEGVTLFDTAEGYGDGKSEEVLGKALEGRRGGALIATKTGGPAYAREEMVAACERSLRRLRTDCIDIYQIHWPRRTAASPDLILETADRLRQSGKIRYFGVCNYGPGDLAALLQHGTIVSDQLAYSLLWRGIEAEVVPILREHGIGVLAYSTLMHGLLSGSYRSLDEFPAERGRTLHFSSSREGVSHGQQGYEELTNRALQSIHRICEAAGVPVAAAAFGWALRRPGITSVLAGARNAEQAVANARIARTDLPDAFIGELTGATEPLREALGGRLDMWLYPGRIG